MFHPYDKADDPYSSANYRRRTPAASWRNVGPPKPRELQQNLDTGSPGDDLSEPDASQLGPVGGIGAFRSATRAAGFTALRGLWLFRLPFLLDQLAALRLNDRSNSAVLPAVSSLKALRRVSRPSGVSKPLIGFGNPLLDGFDSRYATLAGQAREK